MPFVGTIFPNTSYHGRQPRGLCAWHPHSPTSTEGWRFFLVDKDAPAEVKDYLRRYYMRYSGPAGMTEQDDMENWLYATAASTGTVARRYPFNYQQSMGAYSTDHPMLGGEVSTVSHRADRARLLSPLDQLTCRAATGTNCSAHPRATARPQNDRHR